jgi:hypothetical protein
MHVSSLVLPWLQATLQAAAGGCFESLSLVLPWLQATLQAAAGGCFESLSSRKKTLTRDLCKRMDFSKSSGRYTGKGITSFNIYKTPRPLLDQQIMTQKLFLMINSNIMDSSARPHDSLLVTRNTVLLNSYLYFHSLRACSGRRSPSYRREKSTS